MYETNFHKAATAQEAAALLNASEDGKILAGGQTLIPTMKQRLADPTDVIDLSGAADLRGINISGDQVTIGAMVTHAEVAGHAALAALCPSISQLAANIGDPSVRHRGTIGGSLANNDPAADYPAAVLALNARIRTSLREIAADDYFVMYEIGEDDSINELCEKVFDTAISEILNVRSQIDQNTLESAIEALANADRVEVYAFGGSAPVAMDAQHKFFRLKISSSFISDPHIQLMSANSLSKNDVVVAISQSGTTSALIESVKIVRKSGVKVIGIMPGNSPLANICDYPIEINVGDNFRINKPLTSRIAYSAIIDVITMGVAQLKPEAQEHLYNIVDSQRSLKIK